MESGKRSRLTWSYPAERFAKIYIFAGHCKIYNPSFSGFQDNNISAFETISVIISFDYLPE
jgi:hypothetical protein